MNNMNEELGLEAAFTDYITPAERLDPFSHVCTLWRKQEEQAETYISYLTNLGFTVIPPRR